MFRKSLILFSAIAFWISADANMDSLMNIIKQNKRDTANVSALLHYATRWQHQKHGEGHLMMHQALAIAKSLNWERGIFRSYSEIGAYHNFYGVVDSGIIYAEMALVLAEKLGDKKGLANQYNNMGIGYEFKGDFAKSVEFHLKALQVRESIRDEAGVAASYNNLGLVEQQKGNFPAALDYYFKSLEIRERLGDKKRIANAVNNIGIVYRNMNDYKKAEEYYGRAVQLRKELGEKVPLAQSLQNMGIIYADIESPIRDYQKGLDYFFESLKVGGESDENTQLGKTYNNIGITYMHLEDLKKAEEYLLKSVKEREKRGESTELHDSYTNLSIVYSRMGDFKKAMEYIRLAEKNGISMSSKPHRIALYNAYIQLHEKKGEWKVVSDYLKKRQALADSVLNEETAKQFAEMHTRFETDKKEKENLKLKSEAEIKDLQLSEQKTFRNFLFGIIALAVLLIASALIAYRNKQKANLLLTQQKNQIEIQKKEITDSINYAQRIQQSILPPPGEFRQFFPESFILFFPKDIVSGDFYWFTRSKSGGVLLAAADCTGHGVPGAMMSMIGIEKLNALNHLYDSPDRILSDLNRSVKNALRQSELEDASRDGMDIALVHMEKSGSYLNYAGANRPLWVVRNGAMHELKPTKSAIGGRTSDGQEFPSNEFPVQKGDTIYAFTDGYADQFGGSEGKKMMTRNFRELILSIQTLSMEEQYKRLHDSFLSWKGSFEQIDDVLIIGFRV